MYSTDISVPTNILFSLMSFVNGRIFWMWASPKNLCTLMSSLLTNLMFLRTLKEEVNYILSESESSIENKTMHTKDSYK